MRRLPSLTIASKLYALVALLALAAMAMGLLGLGRHAARCRRDQTKRARRMPAAAITT